MPNVLCALSVGFFAAKHFPCGVSARREAVGQGFPSGYLPGRLLSFLFSPPVPSCGGE